MNFFTEAKYSFRTFLLGLKNLKEWFPIVWRDRDWDKDYIMNVLIFKLKKNRDYMVRSGHTSNENSIRTMTECIDLLEKIQNEWENYEEPAYKKHEEKWGKSDFYTEPYSENPKLYVLKDRNDEKYTPQEIEEKRKDFLLASKIGGHKRRRDFQHAMEIFANEFDSWWD